MTEQERHLLTTIRSGVFGAKHGFLLIQRVNSRNLVGPDQLIAKPETEKTERIHMPIIAAGWVNSGYVPHFHSLN